MENNKSCLICKVTDDQLPLLQFSFKSVDHYICSQHIPILIHQANKLADLLPGLGNVDDTEAFNG